MTLFNRKITTRKTLMFILLGIYAIVFAEIFIRIFTPVAIMPRYVTDGGDGIRQNIPNSIYSQSTEEVNVKIRINSQGLRLNHDVIESKLPGSCRIAVFGDSLLMGYEVNLEDSATYILEEMLLAEGKPCQVLNFSVSGFGTAEHLVALQNRALAYQPDLVIFELHMTDIIDNIRSDLYRLKDAKLLRANQTYLPAIEIRDRLMQFALYRWLIGNSHLYSLVRERAAVFVKKIQLSMKKNKQFKTKDKNKLDIKKVQVTDVKPHIMLAARLLDRLLEESRRISELSDAKFAIVQIPVKENRTTFRTVINRKLEPLHIPERFNVIEPLPLFQKNADPRRKLFYETGHGHLSKLGNKLLAQSMFEYILGHELLPSEQ